MWTQLLVFFFRSDNEHFNLDDLKRQEIYFSIHLGERQCIYPPASSKEKLFHAGPGIPIIKWYNAWKYFQKLAHQIYSFTESTQYPISITNLSIRFDNTVKLLFLITQEEVLKHMKLLFFLSYAFSGRLQLLNITCLLFTHCITICQITYGTVVLILWKITKQWLYYVRFY